MTSTISTRMCGTSLVTATADVDWNPALGTLRRWVRAIARNQAGWHSRRLTGQTERASTPESAALLLDPKTGTVAAFDRKQQQLQVRTILELASATLPKLSYRIVLMHWIKEQPAAEIAAELCFTRDGVKAVIRRARWKLSEALRRVRPEAGTGAGAWRSGAVAFWLALIPAGSAAKELA